MIYAGQRAPVAVPAAAPARPAATRAATAAPPGPAARHSLAALADAPIQRAIVAPADATEAQQTAYDQLIAAARAGDQTKTLLEFCETAANNTNLVFRFSAIESHGNTALLANNVDISLKADLLAAYNSVAAIGNLATVAFAIRIDVNPATLVEGEHHFDLLQVMAHEFAVHAAKFPGAVTSLRKLGRLATQNMPAARAGLLEYAESFSSGAMSAREQHLDYVAGADAHYEQLAAKLQTTLGAEARGAFSTSQNIDQKVNIIPIAAMTAIRAGKWVPTEKTDIDALLAMPIATLRGLLTGATTFAELLHHEEADAKEPEIGLL